MTEYKKIETELLALGWSKEPGKGDHVKFLKKGKKIITVSRSISSSGRDLQNIYAQIRRQEPSFLLGKQPGNQAKNNGAEDDNDLLPDNIMPFLNIGNTVRWVSPEARDWSKLQDKDAVMNQPYVVRDYVSDENGIDIKQIIIQDKDGRHDPFPVAPAELESWQTASCAKCGALLPASTLTTDEDGNLTCDNCFAPEEQEPDTFLEPDPATDTKESNAVVDNARNQLNSLKEMNDKFDKLQKEIAPYKGFNFDFVPDKIALDYQNKVKEIIKETDPAFLKNMKKIMPGDIEILNYNPPKNPTTFIIWNTIKTVLWQSHCYTQNINTNDQEEKNDFLRNASYTERFLHTGSGTQPLRIIEINTTRWELTLEVWRHHDDIIDAFNKTGTKKTTQSPLCLLLNNKDKDFRQYLTGSSQQGQQVMETLKKCLNGKELDQLQRAARDCTLPERKEIVRAIQEQILQPAGITDQVQIRSSVYREVDTEDSMERFEQAPAYYQANIMYDDICNDIQGYHDLINTINACKDEKNDRLPVLFRLDLLSKSNLDDWESVYINLVPEERIKVANEERNDDDEQMGYLPGQTLFKIVMHQRADGFSVTTPSFDDQTEYNKYQDCIRDVLYSLHKYKNINPVDPVSAALNDIINNEINEKKNNMENRNLLDVTNPDATLAALRDVTTMELLRELKARGVSFNELNITIKKTIDYESI